MRKSLLLFCILIGIVQVTSAQTVWSKSQGTITFTKAGFADWTQPAHQDRISDSVWITRASNQSIFNIKKENASTSNSPLGTLWAFGTTDSFAVLVYKTFNSLSGNSPQSLIGKDLVLHLTAQNIYLDIKFISFGNSSGGAPLSYTRASLVTAGLSDNFYSLEAFDLKQNYPNPFNPSTTIGFTLQQSGLTSLKIYDAIGREVATLVDEDLEAGVFHQKTFDASKLSSGIYFAKLISGGKTQLKKLVLMK